MTNNDFDVWFKRDIWTHEEAACLFSGLIPDNDTLDMVFIYIEKGHPSKNKILEDHEILKRTDWHCIGSSSSDNDERNFEEYFKLAEFKEIKVDEELLTARDRHIANIKVQAATFKKNTIGNRSSNGPSLISNEMFNTLKPVIDLIDDFKNCPDFKKTGTGLGIDIQQQLITSWLRTKIMPGATKKMTEREAVFLKDLITEHYGLTSGRK